MGQNPLSYKIEAFCVKNIANFSLCLFLEKKRR
jgi:hypothetical protein